MNRFISPRFALPFYLLAGLWVEPVLTADTELNIPGYRVVWYDEFEAAEVDASKWEVNVGVNAWYQRESDGRFVEPHWFGDEFEPWTNVGPINDERQYYSPENVEVVDGVLEIRADREAVADPFGWYQPGYHEFTSGKLNTADEFQFTFGIVRWRAQLPEGQGLWPALWMLNAPDPWYWDDEIDVMEARGSLPTHTTSAHHYKIEDGSGNRQNFYNAGDVDTGINLQTSFNEYTLQWEPTSVRTWVNQLPVFYDDVAIPQGPMFLIMNAAVGGGFDGYPGPETIFPTYFKIDWARVWQPASTPSDLASGGFEDYQGPQWANWNTRDSGNISPVTTGALHGAASVQIGYRQVAVVEVIEEVDNATPANWFTDGTASEWSGYLNQLSAEDEPLGGGPEDPANIPATLGDATAVLPIHQNAPSPRANAVIYRQIDGPFLAGREVTFSGTVTIEEPFPAGASAKAFIRIFNADYSFTDVATNVTAGGDFLLQTPISGAGVPIVQVGLETTGDTGSAGRLAATGLSFVEDLSPAPEPEPEPTSTGFFQTTIVGPGASVHYGVLATNHPTDPIGPGAEGRLSLEFLDSNEGVLESHATVIVDAASGPAVKAYSLQASSPASTASARLRIERVTLDPASDLGGSIVADAAFLLVSGSSELPFFSTPPLAQTVNAGQSASFNLQVSSPGPVSYAWYRDGELVATTAEPQFATHPGSGGSYFVVASNAAGPVISTVAELTIDDPDSDGDGLSDYYEEFVFQTNPLDPNSAFRVSSLISAEGQFSVQFHSVPGVTYQLSTSTDLIDWQAVETPRTADAALTTLMGALPTGVPTARFFRIEVLP